MVCDGVVELLWWVSYRVEFGLIEYFCRGWNVVDK